MLGKFTEKCCDGLGPLKAEKRMNQRVYSWWFQEGRKGLHDRKASNPSISNTYAQWGSLNIAPQRRQVSSKVQRRKVALKSADIHSQR